MRSPRWLPSAPAAWSTPSQIMRESVQTFRDTSASTIVTSRPPSVGRYSRVVQSERLWEVDLLLRSLLLQGLPCDVLEGGLNVYRALGTGLVVRDVVLRLAPRGGSCCLHLPLVLEVGLVPDYNEGEVLRVARARLDQKLVPPTLEGFEGLRSREV